jgi:hypothetical protein
LGCETSRLPHFLDNRLTDGDEIVNLTRRTLFTPWKIAGTYFYCVHFHCGRVNVISRCVRKKIFEKFRVFAPPCMSLSVRLYARNY